MTKKKTTSVDGMTLGDSEVSATAARDVEEALKDVIAYDMTADIRKVVHEAVDRTSEDVARLAAMRRELDAAMREVAPLRAENQMLKAKLQVLTDALMEERLKRIELLEAALNYTCPRCD